MKKENEELVTRNFTEEEIFQIADAKLIFLSMMELIDNITKLEQDIEYLTSKGIEISKIKNVFKDTKYLTFRDPE